MAMNTGPARRRAGKGQAATDKPADAQTHIREWFFAGSVAWPQ
jgi:hypothetical protein